MTDFRALCAELLQFGDQAGEITANEGLWPDCDPGPDWLLDRARAALAEQPVAPTPIPVAERLPGSEDCDAEGRCWWLKQAADPRHDALGATYHLSRLGPAGSTFFKFTHWLPANALPVPAND